MLQTAPPHLPHVSPAGSGELAAAPHAQAGGRGVRATPPKSSQGSQGRPKILLQFPVLPSLQVAPKGFIWSNLCRSFATDGSGTDRRCNPRWDELSDTQSSLRQPAVITGSRRFFHFSPTTPFLMLASECPQTHTPCSTSFHYEKKKIPTPSMNHHDTGGNHRCECCPHHREKPQEQAVFILVSTTCNYRTAGQWGLFRQRTSAS